MKIEQNVNDLESRQLQSSKFPITKGKGITEVSRVIWMFFKLYRDIMFTLIKIHEDRI